MTNTGQLLSNEVVHFFFKGLGKYLNTWRPDDTNPFRVDIDTFGDAVHINEQHHVY